MQMSDAPKPQLVSQFSSAELVIVPPQPVLIPDTSDVNFICVSNAMDPNQYEARLEVSPDLKRWYYFYQFEDIPVIYFNRFKPNTFVRLVFVPYTTP